MYGNYGMLSLHVDIKKQKNKTRLIVSEAAFSTIMAPQTRAFM